MFDNIFNTIIDMKVKKKRDNINTRIDLALYCDLWNLKLLNDWLRVAKPKSQSHIHLRQGCIVSCL